MICPSSLTRPSCLLCRTNCQHALAPSVGGIWNLPLFLLSFGLFKNISFKNRLFNSVPQRQIEFLTRILPRVCWGPQGVLCIVAELAGGGSVAVAVGVIDRWHMKKKRFFGIGAQEIQCHLIYWDCGLKAHWNLVSNPLQGRNSCTDKTNIAANPYLTVWSQEVERGQTTRVCQESSDFQGVRWLGRFRALSSRG